MFERYLKNVVGLVEDDLQLILKQYKSNFVDFEMPLGIYAIKDKSEVVYTMGYHEGALQVTYDDKSMKTKLILTRFGRNF